MSKTAKEWVTHPLFSEMDVADLEVLARCMRRLDVPQGSTLFRRGERTRMMFVIIDGSVEIVEPLTNGRNVSLAVLGPGDVMGEVALLDGAPRKAVALAKTRVACVTLDDAGLSRLLHERPEAARKLMLRMSQNLAQRLDSVWNKAGELAASVRSGVEEMPPPDEVKRSFLGRILGAGPSFELGE